jgi:ATP-dependent helicase IRC3
VEPKAFLMLLLSNYRLLRTAKWRRQPATDGQKTFLTKRLRLNDSDKLSKNLDPELETQASSPSDPPTTKARKPIILDTLTKGQAANIITRLQHGAVRNYETKTKGIRKANKAAEKISKRIERETVRVGPLTA